MKFLKGFHEEWEYILIIFLFPFFIFGELLLVHCTVSVHSPCLWTDFEGVGFLSKFVDREAINTYHGRLIKDFYFQVEGPTIEFSSISPFSHSFFSISPHSQLMAHLLEWLLRPNEYGWSPRFDLWCMDL